MYKELLETMDKLAASLPPEQLERLAAESLEELNSYLQGNTTGIDDLAREMAFRDLTNDVAADAADVGRMQGIAAGAAGTLGALALGKKVMQKPPKGMKKKAAIDMYQSKRGKDVSYDALLTRLKERSTGKEAVNSDKVTYMVEKFASIQTPASALEEFIKIAENVSPEELEIIAEELLEKEAYTPLFRQFAGIQGAIQGAASGRRAFKDAKKGLKMYNQGYGTLPRNQRGAIPQDVQQSYQIDQAIANKGYFGSIGFGAKTGRQQSMNMFDARKQQEAIDNYNLHAGYTPPAPKPSGGEKQNSKQKGSENQRSNQNTQNTQNQSTKQNTPSPPPQPSKGGPQQWAQQAGQWIQNNPYLATAAGVGAGMMLPRAMAGANAAANAQMMVPAAPTMPPPYMYYR